LGILDFSIPGKAIILAKKNCREIIGLFLSPWVHPTDFLRASEEIMSLIKEF